MAIPMACERWVLPSPGAPNRNRGLNGVLPGAEEMLSPAVIPILLHSPVTRLLKQYTGFNLGLIWIFLSPGNTKGPGLPPVGYVFTDTGLFTGAVPLAAGNVIGGCTLTGVTVYSSFASGPMTLFNVFLRTSRYLSSRYLM